jgi:hypothetical protein
VEIAVPVLPSSGRLDDRHDHADEANQHRFPENRADVANQQHVQVITAVQPNLVK